MKLIIAKVKKDSISRKSYSLIQRIRNSQGLSMEWGIIL
jgi:hypothetical protein